MYAALRCILLSLAAGSLVQGIDVTLTSASSIKSASASLAKNLMGRYNGSDPGGIPGILPAPYYWWEVGGMFGHMVDYYYYTGDSTWNADTIQAIDFQAGTDGSLLPPNQTSSEGNDDQVFWAFTAMSAAETKFPPPKSGYASWAAVAQSVFNQQAERWDTQNCGGGLRWQINPLNNGYDYKNMPSNGGFFQLAARLARYTNNDTYVKWAEKSWDWITSKEFYVDTGDAIVIYDGSNIKPGDCATVNTGQYTYNYATLIAGLSYLYNHTEDDKWLTPLSGIIKGLFGNFTSKDVLYEAGCEPYNDCNTDGLTFKSFTIRWLALCTQLVPQMASTIWPVLTASAAAAAGQCDGGSSDTTCGYHWTTTTYDGSSGVGQQMSALSAVNAPLLKLDDLSAPLTLATGATSKQDASAGSTTTEESLTLAKITTADRAGAAILTVLCLGFVFAGTYWLVAVDGK